MTTSSETTFEQSPETIYDFVSNPANWNKTYPGGPDNRNLPGRLPLEVGDTWDEAHPDPDKDSRHVLGRPPRWLHPASADKFTALTQPLLKTSLRRLATRSDVPVEKGRFIAENYGAVARLIDEPPHTVMHGDAHPGNVYFRNDEAGLLDWQAVRRGHPCRERAYTLITGMATADRRAHQHDLLDEYRRALSAAGGPRLDRDDLWDRYRQGALYPYVATLIVAGAGGMQAENITLEGLRRSVAALEDLDTVALLEKSL